MGVNIPPPPVKKRKSQKIGPCGRPGLVRLLVSSTFTHYEKQSPLEKKLAGCS